MNNNQDLKQLTVALIDEIRNIKNKLDKACVLLQDITEDYFDRNYEQQKEMGHYWIIYGFEKNRHIANMVFDYTYAAQAQIKALEEKAEELKEAC